MLRRLLVPLLRPIWNLFLRVAPDGDPWERISVKPRLHLYGSGARRDFSAYLAGPSQVQVTSISDIQDWLLGCRYQTDEALFGEPDFWQHPTTFEHLRAGDCEDFAIWAWRKLVELGFDADLVAGYCLKDGELDGRHAWIVLRHEGSESLFEPVCRRKELMIQPLGAVRDHYLPELGADRSGRRFAFWGYMLAQKRLARSKSARRAG